MIIKNNDLRVTRKQSSLTQSDVTFLLDRGDYAAISRWESGGRLPPLEVMMFYEIIFGLPVEELFEERRKQVIQTLLERVSQRLSQLKTETPDSKLEQRIFFLESLLTKLNHLISL